MFLSHVLLYAVEIFGGELSREEEISAQMEEY
jgi:hypothetical protein